MKSHRYSQVEVIMPPSDICGLAPDHLRREKKMDMSANCLTCNANNVFFIV